MKTATMMKDGLLKGNARLYRLSEPHKDYADKEHEYVIVSAVNSAFAYETYIFPSNEAGDIVDWGEMLGSRQGTQSHEQVLFDIGYEVA